MTNQQFCYWLQGYFEISNNATLTKDKVLLIDDVLKTIHQPLGEFSQWLFDVVNLFATQQYQQEILNFFLPEISNRLNLVFHHVIDNSYDTDMGLIEAKQIHDGRTNDK